jgi:putative tricarboxylic transport membrane protein
VIKSQAYGGFVVFLFGTITAYLSLKMQIGTFRMAGPGLFPLCLGVLLMILSGILIMKTLFGAGRETAQKRSETRPAGSAGQVILFMGAIVVAVLLLQPLGYLFVSFMLLILLLRILGVKPWYRSVLLSLSAALFSYFLFVQWLKIPLPKGWVGL